MSVTQFSLLISCIVAFSCTRQPKNDVITSEVGQEGSSLLQTPSTIRIADTIRARQAPSRITRKFRSDKQGKLLFAAYEDVIEHDGNSFRKIDRPDSLASFDAFDVLVDASGNIWIASTHYGLFKYDGKQFEQFTTDTGLANNRTMCLIEDQWGAIWVGTAGGLSRYGGKGFQSFTMADGLTDNDITALLEDSSGKVWVGTRGTLCFYEPSAESGQNAIAFTEFMNKEGQPIINVVALLEDSQGSLWFGGESGLWKISNGRSQLITNKFVTGVYEDKAGKIWITHRADQANSWSLAVYDQPSLKMIQPIAREIFVGTGMFFSMIEDPQGNLWVGTLDGVFVYNGNSVQYVRAN